MLKYEYKFVKEMRKMANNNKKPVSTSKKQTQREERIKKAKQRKIIKLSIIAGISVLLIALCVIIPITVKSCKEKKENPPITYSYATVNLGSYGSVEIKLDHINAPKSVALFKKLASSGKYDGMEIVRSENGCIYSAEREDLVTTIFGEFTKNGHANTLSHKKGVISMLRDTDYNSANGEFFITTQDKGTSFDGSYAAFGEIVSGMSIIEKIAEDVAENGGSGAYPAITSITFTEKTESAK